MLNKVQPESPGLSLPQGGLRVDRALPSHVEFGRIVVRNRDGHAATGDIDLDLDVSLCPRVVVDEVDEQFLHGEVDREANRFVDVGRRHDVFAEAVDSGDRIDAALERLPGHRPRSCA